MAEIKIDAKATEYLKNKIGGGSGSDTGSVFTGYDLAKAINGKHISVDALIELLEKYDVELSVLAGFNFECHKGDGNSDIICSLVFDSSSYFELIGAVPVEITESVDNIEEALITCKQEIEALTADIYDNGTYEWTGIYYLTIYDSDTTKQVALSDFATIFVE